MYNVYEFHNSYGINHVYITLNLPIHLYNILLDMVLITDSVKLNTIECKYIPHEKKKHPPQFPNRVNPNQGNFQAPQYIQIITPSRLSLSVSPLSLSLTKDQDKTHNKTISLSSADRPNPSPSSLSLSLPLSWNN